MRSSYSTLFAACLLLVCGAPAAARAQNRTGLGDPVVRSDALYLAHRPLAAYELLVEHVRKHPKDYEALWRAARAGVVVSVGLDGHGKENAYLDPALTFARAAVDVRPGGREAVYWRGAAAGRRALNAGPGYAAELAQVTHDDAHTLLGSDSLDARALNMLGKLDFEVMSLSRIQRLVARTFMGNDALDEASWENAERYLVKAVEVAPDVVLYRYDLGALYEKRGRNDDAVTQLEEALRLPPAQPIDEDVKKLAGALLTEVRR